jgi:hypothetical protein
VRLVVFDFDQTISVIHVFKLLAGWRRSGEKSAQSEIGQIRLIDDLNGDPPFVNDGGFAWHALGGKARVDSLGKLFTDLKSQEAELIICTKGLVGAVRKCLMATDLLAPFSEVYGRIGNDYRSESVYDLQASKRTATDVERKLLGSRSNGDWDSKADLIERLKKDRGLADSEVVLVEDDADEIQRARGVCRTVFVRDAKGMTEANFAELRAMTAH